MQLAAHSRDAKEGRTAFALGRDETSAGQDICLANLGDNQKKLTFSFCYMNNLFANPTILV